MKYIWDNEKIKNLYQELKEKSKDSDEKYKQDFFLLNSMLGEKIPQSDILQSEVCNKKIEDIVKSLATEFCQNSIITQNNNSFMTLFRMDNQFYLQLLYDFYGTHNSQIYNAFLEEFNRRYTNLEIFHSIKNFSNSYHFLTQKETFIRITKSYKITDLGKFPHEYGHSVIFLLNPDFVNNLNNIYIREIDGIYFEINFFDYLIKNNILNEQANYCKFLLDYSMYKEAIYLSKGHFNLKSAIYFISYLASIELSLLDNEGRNEIFEKIISFHSQNVEESFSNLSSHITLGKNINNYQKKILKNLRG